jgi:REP element-mobilizing transposase RayT
MRFPRAKAEGQSFYQCVSRVVDRRFIFRTAGHGSVGAERFELLMRRPEAFSGVPVLTYTLMSNHFHLLCEVPQAQVLSEGVARTHPSRRSTRVPPYLFAGPSMIGIAMRHQRADLGLVFGPPLAN